jgi:hypothetical protein
MIVNMVVISAVQQLIAAVRVVEVSANSIATAMIVIDVY